MSKQARMELLIGSLLLLVLAITRSGITRSHFGTDLNLPDASWAMFWLLGAFTMNRWWPALSMLVCVAIDYFVIAQGVSSYCFTPAYPFLIPAYLALWAMGRWSRNQLPIRANSLLTLIGSVVAGVSACFFISNIGFYLSSGYFANMPVAAYAQAVARYWPYYMLHAAAYVATGLIVHYIASHRALQRSAKNTT